MQSLSQDHMKTKPQLACHRWRMSHLNSNILHQEEWGRYFSIATRQCSFLQEHARLSSRHQNKWKTLFKIFFKSEYTTQDHPVLKGWYEKSSIKSLLHRKKCEYSSAISWAVLYFCSRFHWGWPTCSGPSDPVGTCLVWGNTVNWM